MSPNQMPRKASPVRTTKRWDYDSSSESYGVDVDVKVIRSLGKPNRPFAVGPVAAMLKSHVAALTGFSDADLDDLGGFA